MSVKSVLEYHLGLDFIREKMDAERQYLQAVTGKEDALPVEAGIRAAVRVYEDRLITSVQYPGIILMRALGIDRPLH